MQRSREKYINFLLYQCNCVFAITFCFNIFLHIRTAIKEKSRMEILLFLFISEECTFLYIFSFYCSLEKKTYKGRKKKKNKLKHQKKNNNNISYPCKGHHLFAKKIQSWILKFLVYNKSPISIYPYIKATTPQTPLFTLLYV